MGKQYLKALLKSGYANIPTGNQCEKGSHMVRHPKSSMIYLLLLLDFLFCLGGWVVWGSAECAELNSTLNLVSYLWCARQTSSIM